MTEELTVEEILVRAKNLYEDVKLLCEEVEELEKIRKRTLKHHEEFKNKIEEFKKWINESG